MLQQEHRKSQISYHKFVDAYAWLSTPLVPIFLKEGNDSKNWVGGAMF